MKNKSLVITILFAIVLAPSLFLSCSKEKVSTPLSENSMILPEQVSTLDIQSFLYLANHSGDPIQVKTEKYYTASEVFNLIGATLNYTYCFPTENVKNIEWVEQIIEIPISLQLGILESDAVAAYSSAIDYVRVSFRSIDKTDKYLLSVFIKDLGIENSTKLRLKLVSQIGNGINPGTTGFENTDEYFFTRDSYKCDETGEEGAPNILEQMIYFKYKTAPAPGWHIWYWPQTDYQPYYSNFGTGNPIDNFCDYKIFYASSSVRTISSETKCLGYDQANSGINEMDFYLNGADQICYNWLMSSSLNPNGYDFNNCSFLSSNDNNTQIQHFLYFNFGHRNAVKEEEEANDYPIMID